MSSSKNTNPFDEIRRTCAYALTVARHATVDEAGLERFAQTIHPEQVKARVQASDTSENSLIDIEFANVRDECNYRVLYGMMQLGHGFRYELHRTVGSGASKTITAGMNSLARARRLTAVELSKLTTVDIQEHFGITEAYLTKEPALKVLVEQILVSLQKTGEILVEQGHADFYDWTTAILDEVIDNKPAAQLVLALKETFPHTLNDVGTLQDGTEVWLLKKAILARHEVHRCVPGDEFRLTDMSDMTAIVDNVDPAMLVKHGCLKLSDELAAIVQGGKLLPAGPREAEMRAVAIGVIERLSRKTGVPPARLSHYLWLFGKDGDNRAWMRHHTQDTMFY